MGLNFWGIASFRTAVKAGLLMKKAFARPVARGCKVEVKVLTRRMETANKGRDEEVPSQCVENTRTYIEDTHLHIY